MMWVCTNCKVPMADDASEDGRCPTCGLHMVATTVPSLKNVEAEFELILTALLHGKKP